MKKLLLFSSLFCLVLLSSSCNDKSSFNYYYYTPEETAVISQYLNLPALPDDYTVNLPSHLSNTGLFPRPVERDKAVLGRVIFYDKHLSKDGTISCANCHKQELAFSDNKIYSTGVYDRSTARNSIALGSVANFSAYYGTDLNGSSAIRFFWDNRAETAAEQCKGSMTNEREMDMKLSDIVEAVQSQPYYTPLFNKAFGDDNVTSDRVLEAVSNFVNAMGSFQSKFDAEANGSSVSYSNDYTTLTYKSDFSGFTASENRGKTLYNNNCATCHSGNMGRPVLQFSNNGLDAVSTDLGVGGISKKAEEEGSFKVPTLRNIALTAPYMHDGRFATLQEVIDFYSSGIQAHAHLSPALKSGGLHFSESEKADLAAFLNTLTDDRLLSEKRFSDPFKH